jgi:hypothetical protein
MKVKNYMKSLWFAILLFFGVKSREVASPTPSGKFPLKLDLQFFSEDLGVESGEVADPTPIDEPMDNEPPLDTPPTDPPQDDLEQSKAFARRLEERTQKALQEARQQWELETSQRYGNYDQYQQSMDYLMQRGGYQNFEEFQAAIQEAQLAERAEQNGIDPEFQSRMEKLEERAKLADELEQQRQQEQTYQQFQSALKDFSQQKGVDPAELESFMVENQIANFEMAYRAFHYEQMQNDLTNAKDVAVKEYLQSKKAPKVEGPGTPGIIKDGPPKNFEESRQRALERLRSARTNE